MVEVDKTSDPVRISYLRAVLADAGIETFVADAGAAGLWGSTIPARLMVDDADAARARRLIDQAEPE